MRTLDLILYVVAIVLLVVVAWVGTLTQRLFALALVAVILVPLITLART